MRITVPEIDAIRTFRATNKNTGEILTGSYAEVIRAITRTFANDIYFMKFNAWILEEKSETK